MDCTEVENLLGSGTVWAREADRRDALEAHLKRCRACRERAWEEGEIAAELARIVPRRVAPSRVRELLLARVASAGHGPAPRRRWMPPMRLPTLRAGPALRAVAAAGALVAVLATTTSWFHSRLESVEQANETLQSRLDTGLAMDQQLYQDGQALGGRVRTMVRGEAQIAEMVRQQRYLAYMAAAPDRTVTVLWSTEKLGSARGLILLEGSSSMAILTALDLPRLPIGGVYTVWLIAAGGERYPGGVFTVDSTGYGQTVIIPVVPWSEIESVEIEVEPAGNSILRGDL